MISLYAFQGIHVVGKGSWKEREVGKFQVEKSEVGKFLLERAYRSWKEPSEVGSFPTLLSLFQVQFKLSNFISHLLTSARTFQLRHELFNFNLSNFILDFPTSRSFQLPFPSTRIPFQVYFRTFVVIIFRLLPAIFLGDGIYGDEQDEFECVGTQPGCRNMCFTEFSPMQPPRMWCLQILLSCVPPVIFNFYAARQTAQEKI